MEKSNPEQELKLITALNLEDLNSLIRHYKVDRKNIVSISQGKIEGYANHHGFYLYYWG